MNTKYSFSDEEISSFCELTKDTNLLHNLEFMSEQGKRPIVPGMMNIAYFMSHLPKDTESSQTHIFSFNDVMSSEEGSSLYIGQEAHNLIASSTKYEGDKAMKEFMHFIFSPHKILPSSNKDQDSIQVVTNPLFYSMGGFEEMFLFGERNMSMYALAIAQSSGALLDGLHQVPELSDLVENMKIDERTGTPRILPAYTEIQIVKEQGIPEINGNAPLIYIIQARKEGKRDLEIDFECRQDKLIYTARANLKILPFRAVLRAAADLPNTF